MKSWPKPEVKVFSVKMDENIAASGESTQLIMHQKQGVIASEWPTYNYFVAAGETIVDTGVKYFYTASEGNSNYYTLASETQVSSCRAS